MPPQPYFPLRWEIAGDHWWYASPIDWAAASGHYDLVRELLHLDANLLIKLTSLRRIRRLETVWDDDARFAGAAKGRSSVALNLLLECETGNGRNALMQGGYGGWLLYSAASAGELGFVKELLERDTLLVFGEGEYGVTDIFYAAARSKNSEVFRMLYEHAATAARREDSSVFHSEIVCRAVHAAARGGNLEMLRELLSSRRECYDVLGLRDVQGSTILHAASARGQLEVVKYIVSSFDIINSKDNQGNIALHTAALRGHLSVVEALIIACPASSFTTNNAGDTFLHMAVAGLRAPGFRRLNRQMELMKQLISGSIVNIHETINITNNEGRTALHVAVTGNVHSDLVELLMTVQSIDLNIRDINGMTPLDLLSQCPLSTSSEILIKQLVSAGGVFSARAPNSVSAVASQLRRQRMGSSPGTNFKVSDAEIFLYTGIEVSETSERPNSCSSSTTHFDEVCSDKKQNSANRAANKLKILLRWARKKEKEGETTPKKLRDGDSMESLKKWSQCDDTPTPLRQRFSKTSLWNNRCTLAVRSEMPSPAAKKKYAVGLMPSPAGKKKYAVGLMHGVIRATPHLAPPSLEVEDSVGKQQPGRLFKRSLFSVAC